MGKALTEGEIVIISGDGTPDSEPVYIVPDMTVENVMLDDAAAAVRDSVEPLNPVHNTEPAHAGIGTLLPNALDRRVTMGADLTGAQRRAVYEDFGIAEGTVGELTVTNFEERAYLEGLVPDKKIGTVSISCAFIQLLPRDSGLSIILNNITYFTEKMYRSALLTAGVKDAYVVISAPFPVSGTGALTGIYKAYEDMTGEKLSETAKNAGAQELVLIGELSEKFGDDATETFIRILKGMRPSEENVSDRELEKSIKSAAKETGISVSGSQMKQLIRLVKRFESLDNGRNDGEDGFLSTVGDLVSGIFG